MRQLRRARRQERDDGEAWELHSYRLPSLVRRVTGWARRRDGALLGRCYCVRQAVIAAVTRESLDFATATAPMPKLADATIAHSAAAIRRRFFGGWFMGRSLRGSVRKLLLISSKNSKSSSQKIVNSAR